MIDLYYWTTPNGHKITMFLEEAGMPYTLKPVAIGKGDQFDPAFLKISPNNKIPAIVDHAPADGGKARERLRVGRDPALPRRQVGPVHPEGPARPGGDAGVAHVADGRPGSHARARTTISPSTRPEKIPYAIDRYVKETSRLYGVLNKRLAGRDFIVGKQYTIADMASLSVDQSANARDRTSTSSRT